MKQSMSVTSWLESYDNPMNDVVRRIRDVILHADARIRESLDGNAPTFSYRGTLASIFPESKKHASLMIPQGAEIPGHHPRLEGSGDTRRVMKIASLSEANAAKDDLQHLVRAWCDWRDAEGAEEEAAPAEEKATEPAAKKAKPAAKKARKPAAKKASAPAAKKARKPAAKKAGGATGKKGGKPAAKKAQKPTSRKSAKPATTKGRGGRRGA